MPKLRKPQIEAGPVVERVGPPRSPEDQRRLAEQLDRIEAELSKKRPVPTKRIEVIRMLRKADARLLPLSAEEFDERAHGPGHG